VPLPEQVQKRFLPASDYARAKAVNWGEYAKVQKPFVDRYLAEVR
jgi:putative spermidine/putrescine transport system substrate-binding protein